MNKEKISQYVAMIGGFLGALYLALQSTGIEFLWFNQETIDAWMAVLNAGIPLVLVVYGVYKNQYVLTNKAKRQEAMLKEKNMK